jgi:hypothetical protein
MLMANPTNPVNFTNMIPPSKKNSHNSIHETDFSPDGNQRPSKLREKPYQDEE